MAGAGSGVAMGRRTGASQRERKVLFYTFQFLPPSSAVDGRLSAALSFPCVSVLFREPTVGPVHRVPVPTAFWHSTPGRCFVCACS